MTGPSATRGSTSTEPGAPESIALPRNPNQRDTRSGATFWPARRNCIPPPPTVIPPRHQKKRGGRGGQVTSAKQIATSLHREAGRAEIKAQAVHQLIYGDRTQPSERIHVCMGRTLNELRSRHKTDTLASQAASKTQSMRKTSKPICETCILVEDTPTRPATLAAYISRHKVGDVEVIDGFEVGPASHSISENLTRLSLALGELTGDQCHHANVECPFMIYELAGEEGDTCVLTENAGTQHNVELWFAQGHPNDPPSPSTDICSSNNRHEELAAHQYYLVTDRQSAYLNVLMKCFFSTEYATLIRAAKAGWWVQGIQSCFLGLATVWKLQVDAHLDEKDYEVCVITCGGEFHGGELYLPDLDVCFEWSIFLLAVSLTLLTWPSSRYNPGDIVIFRSPYLYHTIGPWEPLTMVSESKTMPERVSWVRFTHSDTVNYLKGRNWRPELEMGFDHM
ncbi:uncharacterized protein EV420DRAFT_1637834 [Desarmillaria tabescens]|uniref:Uncharacterized protein n=1 Tax=Armillaria tabescens TaxID=1929756 RepID=A0AA39NEQ9_ARMTA|nr:uncharacterized protein EV420DRAFT_1637834 [Desarmillaria tabescens]KAK0464270.1 hypothetical protein EV420DRAFT_1637834 [Desarmillaria tabescens]